MSAVTGVRLRILPSRRLLGVALLVTALVALAVALGWWAAGPVAALGIALGVVAAVPAATAAVDPPLRLLAFGTFVAAVPLGLAVAGHPVAAGAAVLLAGLAQAPLGTRAAGLLTMLPVLVALFASAGLPDRPVAFAVAVLVGCVAAVAIARGLGMSVPPVVVDRRTAWRHAVATGVAAGVATWVSVALEAGHGYWLVLTIAAVLRPTRGETRPAARDRVLATVAGVLVAVAAVVLLPRAAALLLAGLCLLLTLAWTLAADQRLAALYGAPLVVLLGSSGLVGPALDLAVERTVLTLAGALLASGLAALVLRPETVPAEPC